jgi:penicillin-binding protein 1A
MKRVTGGSIPAIIWRETMTAALNDPTPAPDHVPVSSDGAFGGLLDRVLSFPAGNEDSSAGTAYDGAPRDSDPRPGFWFWNKSPEVEPKTPENPVVDGVYSPPRTLEQRHRYNN